MRDFEPTDNLPLDRISLFENNNDDASVLGPDILYKNVKKDDMNAAFGHHYESFWEFISEPAALLILVVTVVISVLIPVIGGRYLDFRKMNNNNDVQDDDKTKLVDSDDESSVTEDESHLADAKKIMPLADLTEEERVLLAGTIDADDGESAPEILSTLSNLKFHGKLATAHLRVRQQKIVGGMTDEEREKEKAARNEQLAKIFAMMSEQQDKFGISSQDELNEQLKMYSV